MMIIQNKKTGKKVFMTEKNWVKLLRVGYDKIYDVIEGEIIPVPKKSRTIEVPKEIIEFKKKYTPKTK